MHCFWELFDEYVAEFGGGNSAESTDEKPEGESDAVAALTQAGS